ncbi:uncharacterized protein C4orf19 homolog [Eublepharis macularius]|uniref:Uncharacterized protein C4orf19 homolog n=1 Tax=Eublepharis macularius TaxID=481883 RepID=A0AA97LG45_EUBMA|nr:uncharacterized protein C4orf19 homolog [Eublepharis macularius]XP_054854134.1 uncharacterized protein C4orf19 homolog [Eublepharis macularius]XP_054854135.1 uncharacterized protein C4orf19 homolog [Eublepharis macularius]
MGCRCCKMIQSYIFDPQEVQASGCINEINNYRYDTQDGGKFKCKYNVEIQVHKNELQKAELQPTVNRNKLNNTKDAVRNHRNTAVHEEGLSNCLEKSNININGVHSYSNLKSNHSANQNKEVSIHVCSAQRPSCSARELSQPQEFGDKILEADHSQLPLEAIESNQYRQLPTTGEKGSLAQSATLEAQNNGICSPAPDFSKNATQQTMVGSESLSNSYTHPTQSTECTVLNKHEDPALCKAKRCNSGDQTCKTGTVNGRAQDKTASDSPSSPRSKAGALLEAGEVCCGDFNGEFEDEDADIAEALAALEAATAGEDLEEEGEEC